MVVLGAGGHARLLGVVVAVVLVLPLSGCSRLGGGATAVAIQDVAHRNAARQEAAAPSPSRLTVNPPDGSNGVSPSDLVTAVVAGGQLSSVDLRTADGVPLEGALSPDGGRWNSTTPMRPATSYVLTASTVSETGQRATRTTRFSTQAPDQQVAAKIVPADGSSINSIQPVTVEFDKPVTDRGAAERALQVVSSPTVAGHAQWVGDRVLRWLPDGTWPMGGTLTVSLALYGRQLGPNIFGTEDERAVLRVGPEGDTAMTVRARLDNAPLDGGAPLDNAPLPGSVPAANPLTAPEATPRAPAAVPNGATPNPARTNSPRAASAPKPNSPRGSAAPHAASTPRHGSAATTPRHSNPAMG
ncbi:MAG TPA: Ig-like domain-containing protein [Pseudonocardia sp.]|jgi:lipoprotein-anchoring transpeptidase ErfK/SrfK|uniref:Ig-like domain-containing protein n=1 Tax=Pseudonocardia sp. TaxID=60912 RepID=UPI002F3E2739